MTQDTKPRKRRRRGVILTQEGLKKLEAAKAEAEFDDNDGRRYTLESMSERTGLAVDTLMKVFACESGVDRQTLRYCFRGFNLELEKQDYFLPDISPEDDRQPVPEEKEPELPEGQVPLNSLFYVERPPIEADCFKNVLQPGALIRIKAPRRMGKTSLMSRILYHAAQEGCRTVSLSLQLADRDFFETLDKFLQWFCANVTLGLQLPNRLSEYWDDVCGSKISAKIYFEQHLLSQSPQPLVLALDDVDRLFLYSDLADDFFGLLRAWHEEGKNREIWQRFRLIVAHSTEVYIPLNVNQSPFNVGFPVELTELTAPQVQALAKYYELDWTLEQVQQLLNFVGGHPYLLRLALYHIWHKDTTLTELLDETSPTAIAIYHDQLQRQLWSLQQDQILLAAFAQVVQSAVPMTLDLVQAFKLQSMGLIHLQGTQVEPSCRLYAQYFQAQFQKSK